MRKKNKVCNVFLTLVILIQFECFESSENASVSTIPALFGLISNSGGATTSIGTASTTSGSSAPGTNTGSNSTVETERQSVTGQLKDSNGNPLANATLIANTSGSSQRAVSAKTEIVTTTTDSNGNFSLRLAIGNFTVSVTTSSGASFGSFTIGISSANSQPVVQVATGSFSVSVSVTNPSNTPNSTTPPNTSSVTPPINTSTPNTGIVVTQSAPTNLAYSGSPFLFTNGTSISIQSPTITGTISSCISNPALPTGLSLNSSTCAISGTPSVNQSATNHTITASNSVGSVSIVISVTVSPAGSPPTITYAGSPFSFTLGNQISSISPTLSGNAPTQYISNPALPSGLSIHPTTCIISGTPTVTQPTSSYTITASNIYGSANAGINIGISFCRRYATETEVTQIGFANYNRSCNFDRTTNNLICINTGRINSTSHTIYSSTYDFISEVYSPLGIWKFRLSRSIYSNSNETTIYNYDSQDRFIGFSNPHVTYVVNTHDSLGRPLGYSTTLSGMLVNIQITYDDTLRTIRFVSIITDSNFNLLSTSTSITHYDNDLIIRKNEIPGSNDINYNVTSTENLCL